MIALSISMPEDWSGSILYCELRFFYVSGFTNLQPLIFPNEISSNQSRKKTPSFPSYPILYFQKFFYYVTKTFFIISSSFPIYGASVTLTVTVTFFAASDRFCISKVAAAFAGNGPVGKSFAFWSSVKV
jgi:hypothetical protein